jgi:PAS domain S-box-containing protein
MQKLKELFEHSNSLLCISNLDGQWVELSSTWADILGYNLKELYEISWKTLVHPSDYSVTQEAFARLKKGEKLVSFRNRYIHKNGSHVWLAWELSFSKKHQHVNSVARNVTEHVIKESLLQQASEMGNIGSWRVYLQSNKVFWSDKVYEIHEVPLDTPIKLEEGINFYVPEHQKIIEEKVQSAIEFGEPWDIELQIITAQGNKKWIRTIGECHRVNGQAVELRGIFQDMDAASLMQKRGSRLQRSLIEVSSTPEQSLQLKENQYREIYENSAELLLSYDVSTKHILECNRTLITKLGYVDKQSLMGKNFETLFSTHHQKDVRAIHQKFMDYGFVKNIHIQLQHRNGEGIDTLCTIRAVRGKDGKILHARVYFSDVSEIHKLKAQLREKDLLFQVLSEVNTDGWWDWDLLNPEEEYYSPSLKKLFGYEDHEVPNKSSWWQNQIFEEDKDMALKAYEDHIQEGKPYNLAVRYRHKNQSTVWVLCRGVAIKDENGRPIRMIGTHTDITSLKQTQADLSQTIEELENYVYMASHDLRAPIRHIATYTNFIREELMPKGNTEQQKWFDFIQEATKRMNDMIDAILRYSRIGRQEFNHQQVNVKNLGKNIELMFAEQIAVKKATFNYELQCPIYGDSALLSIMLQNLVENALKFSRPNTPPIITIGTYEQSSHHVLTVEDNGIGIPQEHAYKIFDIFRRLHHQKDYQGLGIGLASCKKIAQMHGGFIQIQSAQHKTKFSIYLPKYASVRKSDLPPTQ